MTQVYKFIDGNGETRLYAEMSPDIASGGTISGALTLAPPADVLPLYVVGATGNTADLAEIFDDGGNGVQVTSTGKVVLSPAPGEDTALDAAAGYSKLRGGVAIRNHSAPADGDIATGELFLWFDQTNGVGNTKLMVKGKSADGTVKTAAIVLA